MNFKKTGLYQQINNILFTLNRWNGSVDLQINYKCTKTCFESVNKVVTWVPQVREWITPPFRSPFLPALLSGQPTVQHSSQPDDSWSQTYLHQCPLTVDSWTTQWINIVIKVLISSMKNQDINRQWNWIFFWGMLLILFLQNFAVSSQS